MIVNIFKNFEKYIRKCPNNFVQDWRGEVGRAPCYLKNRCPHEHEIL